LVYLCSCQSIIKLYIVKKNFQEINLFFSINYFKNNFRLLTVYIVYTAACHFYNEFYSKSNAFLVYEASYMLLVTNDTAGIIGVLEQWLAVLIKFANVVQNLAVASDCTIGCLIKNIKFDFHRGLSAIMELQTSTKL
jgi:hypothetical protein